MITDWCDTYCKSQYTKNVMCTSACICAHYNLNSLNDIKLSQCFCSHILDAPLKLSSSLVEASRPLMCVSDKRDIENVLCWRSFYWETLPYTTNEDVEKKYLSD